jgi:glutamyl-tRNA synthetase
MPDSVPSAAKTPRVRFAPSPTGFLHVGSARTFIFNWLYARHNHGTMVLRLDDTDVERNTEASVQSIFEGLRWLGLSWDEEYKQSLRLPLHRQAAEAIFAKGLAYRDFTPARSAPTHSEADEQSSSQGALLFNPGMRDLSLEESDRRAAAGEPFALRYRVPRGQGRTLRFVDAVYGEQSKLADEVEDFALLRSDGMPTYHLASCVDDADLRISHIIRGQDHLTNTFKHLALFEALGVQPPQFAHLPLLVAPDGAKLSKRRHGPVVSVTTYRDAGFLPQAFVNFLCLLGWSPKDDREFLTLDELTAAFTLEGVNRANAVINFSEAVLNSSETALSSSETALNSSETVLNSSETALSSSDLQIAEILDSEGGGGFNPRIQPTESTRALAPEGRFPPIAPGIPGFSATCLAPFDPKAVWLNAEHIRALPVAQLSPRLQPFFEQAGLHPSPEKLLAVTPLIRERIKLLRDAVSAADFFFLPQLAPYDPAELIPQKGDAALARRVLEHAREVLATTSFDHDSLDRTLRQAAQSLGLKAGSMFQPIRVAVCGRKNAPPLFETMAVLGRDVCLARIRQAEASLQSLA